jgi:transcriptional regulator with XRE-family HTH domain
MQHTAITSDEIRAIRDRLGFTQPQLAGVLGVTRITVSRWESGGQMPPPRLIELLRLFEQAADPLLAGFEASRILRESGGLRAQYFLMQWAWELEAAPRAVARKRESRT